MTNFSRTSLLWVPRVLSIAFIVFLSMFALDVFNERMGFWPTLVDLTIHLLPSLVLLVGLVLAWRWEWVGAAVFAGAAALYTWMVLSGHLAAATRATTATRLIWILTIAAPALIVGILFLGSWLRHDELHARHP